MSYYNTLEVLALCDTLDKVQHIRQDPEELQRRKHPRSYPIDASDLRIPKIAKASSSNPQHDLLELDSVYKDKKQHPHQRAYNDDIIRQQILSSSEAASAVQRKSSILNQSSVRSTFENTTIPNNSQQVKLLQNKKALQHQHFQPRSFSNRLPGLATTPPYQSPTISTPSLTSPISTPVYKAIKTPNPTTSTDNSTVNSRASTPSSHTPRVPHNAGTTSSDDGTQEECDFCRRIFRGAKSSTHKQQHIKRIHPDSYVRKKGGIKKQRDATLNSF